MKIVAGTICDRASRGEYEDISGLAIEAGPRRAIVSPFELERQVIADGAGSRPGGPASFRSPRG